MIYVSDGFVEFAGPVEWGRFGDDPLDWVERIFVDSGSLGPLPPGKTFAQLKDIDAGWSDDMAPWLSLPSLERLSLTRPTPSLLREVNGKPLTFLRLERPLFQGAIEWPSLPRLERLWLYSWKCVHLHGARFPRLEELRIDSSQVVLDLHVLDLEQPLNRFTLEDVGQLAVPELLWASRVETLSAVGSLSRSPWIVEACRLINLVDRVHVENHEIPPVVEKRLATLSQGKFTHVDLHENSDSGLWSLEMDCEMIPVMGVLDKTGYASTGNLWVSFIKLRYPVIADRVRFEAVRNRLAVYGPEDYIRALGDLLEFLITNPARFEKALKALTVSGMTLND